MIFIWGTPVMANIEDIIIELQAELRNRSSPLLRDVKQTVGNIMITCPNHADGQERNPSCGVSLQEVVRGSYKFPAGTAHCFTCRYTADLPELISFCFGYKDGGVEGFRWIVARFLNLQQETRKLDISLNRDQERLNKENCFISEEELESYRYYHPYMYERKLTDNIIEMFDVGYDQETDSITFPVQNKDGQVLFIQRRSTKGKRFVNPEDDRKPVYGLYQIYKNIDAISEVWVTESPIDALTCWSYGKPAVALMGMPSSEQLQEIQNIPIRKIVLALDNDSAGRNEQKRIFNVLKGKILYSVIYPYGIKDINDLTKYQFKQLKISLI